MEPSAGVDGIVQKVNLKLDSLLYKDLDELAVVLIANGPSGTHRLSLGSLLLLGDLLNHLPRLQLGGGKDVLDRDVVLRVHLGLSLTLVAHNQLLEEGLYRLPLLILAGRLGLLNELDRLRDHLTPMSKGTSFAEVGAMRSYGVSWLLVQIMLIIPRVWLLDLRLELDRVEWLDARIVQVVLVEACNRHWFDALTSLILLLLIQSLV